MKRFFALGILVVFTLSCSVKEARKLESIPAAAGVAQQRTPLQRALNHGYPRLANQLQVCCTGPRIRSLLDELYYYDFAVIEADLVHSQQEYLGENGILRSRNPNLILLTYFSGGDVNP